MYNVSEPNHHLSANISLIKFLGPFSSFVYEDFLFWGVKHGLKKTLII